MVARPGFAVPLDRSEVRSSPSGNLNLAGSQLPVISPQNIVRRASRGDSETKHSRKTLNTASFLIGSLFMSRELGWEQQ